MDGGKNGNGLLGDINARENGGSLRDTWETLVKNFCRQMTELEVDVILLGTDTTTLTDFNGHTP